MIPQEYRLKLYEAFEPWMREARSQGMSYRAIAAYVRSMDVKSTRPRDRTTISASSVWRYLNQYKAAVPSGASDAVFPEVSSNRIRKGWRLRTDMRIIDAATAQVYGDSGTYQTFVEYDPIDEFLKAACTCPWETENRQRDPSKPVCAHVIAVLFNRTMEAVAV